MSPRIRKSTTAKAATAKGTSVKKPRSAKKTAPAATAPRSAKKTAPAATAPRAAKKTAPAVKARRAAKPDHAALHTLEELIMQALVMELDAGQRYAELADAMETHNNLEVAALFRKMADIELKHARQIQEELGWTTIPGPRAGIVPWAGFEAPETTPGDEVHYLMQPYHALELALANEQRAVRFFGKLARAATNATVRKAARELEAEEREHVELVRAWMKKVPKPDADWANDPDPPVYTD